MQVSCRLHFSVDITVTGLVRSLDHFNLGLNFHHARGEDHINDQIIRVLSQHFGAIGSMQKLSNEQQSVIGDIESKFNIYLGPEAYTVTVNTTANGVLTTSSVTRGGMGLPTRVED